jgi:hypothetical protein
MTEEQRKKGGVVIHIFIVLYLFVATAIACDDFFVPSLEKICDGGYTEMICMLVDRWHHTQPNSTIYIYLMVIQNS